MLLDVNGIKEIIPHRYPFLLVDCIEEMEPGVKAVGHRNRCQLHCRCQECNFQRTFLSGTFSTETSDAGSPDRRSAGAGGGSCRPEPGGEQRKAGIFRRN